MPELPSLSSGDEPSSVPPARWPSGAYAVSAVRVVGHGVGREKHEVQALGDFRMRDRAGLGDDRGEEVV